MKRTTIFRQLYFLTLIARGGQSLLSFLLTLALFLCLLLAAQSERIDTLVRWVKAEPSTRARTLEAWLAKSDFVERATIAKIDRIKIDGTNVDGRSAEEDSLRGWQVSDASFLLASGIEARFDSLSLLPRNLRLQGLQVIVPPKRPSHSPPSEELATTETTKNEAIKNEAIKKKSREILSQEFWHKLVRQVGFFTSLATEHTLTLEDSTILFEDHDPLSSGQPLLRLRFEKIVASNRFGLTWRGRGSAEGGGGGAVFAAQLIGNYAPASKRLYQSLRLENFSPQDMLRLIGRKSKSESENSSSTKKADLPTPQEKQATRRWLEGKGQVSLDYRLDLRGRQSWFRARFVRNEDYNEVAQDKDAQDKDAQNKKAALSFDRSTDNRRTGLTNTSLSVRALPLGVVWHASELLSELLPVRLSREALPFQLSGLAEGRLSLQQQQQTPNRFLGNLSLETPRFQWKKSKASKKSNESSESNEIAQAHRLTLAIEGSDEKLQIKVGIDLDASKEAGIDKSITILPHEESATQQNILPARSGSRGDPRKTWDPSQFRLTLEGSSRGGVPVQTVRALWHPRFKPNTRKTVVEVTKGGEITDLMIALDTRVDLKAKTRRVSKFRLANLEGSFQWQKGRLQLFAEPATLTEVEAHARFTKREILFKVKQARYGNSRGDVRGDFRIEDGEVSFERKTLANGKKHTLMRLALEGEGAVEALRRFILNAPFLQKLEALQQNARGLPKAPRATAKGHINMIAFLDQLNLKEADEASETIFPHPLSYDMAWQAEGIRLQAPFLRFYEGSATLASTSSIPLLLSVRATSERGATLKGRWLIVAENAQALRQQQETQRVTLEGSLDAKALESDFPYLPKGWIDKDLPLSLSYREKAGASAQGLLSLVFSRSRLRVESSQNLGGAGSAPVRLSGSIEGFQKNEQTQASAWQIEGRFRPQGKTSILIERGRGQRQEKSLALLLENLPKFAGETTSAQKTSAPKVPAEWRLSLEGEELDLSGWLAQKPWRSFIEEEKGGEQPPSLGWGGLVNLTFDARVKRLQLQKNVADTLGSRNNNPRANDRLEEVRASLRWQDEKIRKASFSSHSLLFSRSEKRQRRQAKRRVRTRAFYTISDGKELFSVYIEDLGSFLHQTLGKNIADGGRTQVSFVRSYRERQRPKPHFEGYASVRNVSLYSLPLLLKIFDAVDFVSAFSKGIRGLDVRSDLQLWDGILTLKEFSLTNNLTALNANGSIDLKKREIDLRGEIASLHLVSKILRNIPLIGAIIVGKKKHNLFAFAYEAKGEWSNPKVVGYPLNILLPGIIKIANPLQLLERDEIKKAQDKRRKKIADEQKNKTTPLEPTAEEITEEATKPAEEER